MRAIIVTELCKGNLRRHIIQDPKNIPGYTSTPPFASDRNTIRWAKDIADALDFIHNLGIVHRDLKLENILVRKQDIPILVCLANFGRILGRSEFRS